MLSAHGFVVRSCCNHVYPLHHSTSRVVFRTQIIFTLHPTHRQLMSQQPNLLPQLQAFAGTSPHWQSQLQDCLAAASKHASAAASKKAPAAATAVLEGMLMQLQQPERLLRLQVMVRWVWKQIWMGGTVAGDLMSVPVDGRRRVDVFCLHLWSLVPLFIVCLAVTTPSWPFHASAHMQVWIAGAQQPAPGAHVD